MESDQMPASSSIAYRTDYHVRKLCQLQPEGFCHRVVTFYCCTVSVKRKDAFSYLFIFFHKTDVQLDGSPDGVGNEAADNLLLRRSYYS